MKKKSGGNVGHDPMYLWFKSAIY